MYVPIASQSPISVTTRAAIEPAFHVAVQETRYTPAEGLLVVPAWLEGTVELGVVSAVVVATVVLPPVPNLM